jgi:hypothetical protein
MQFLARWGNACGTDFKKDDFCNLHAQWEYQRAYLEDRLRKPWVVCTEVNIKNPNAVMSTAIKVYDFSTGSAIGSTSAKDSVSTNATISKPLSPVTSPVTATLPAVPALPAPLSPVPALPPPVPAVAPLPALPAPAISLPLPSSSKNTLMSNPTTTHKLVKQHEPINNNSISYDDDLFAGIGGSHKLSQEFDNNKELKEFNKMFKKQNRKSYKSKNSNTRRNKKNDK